MTTGKPTKIEMELANKFMDEQFNHVKACSDIEIPLYDTYCYKFAQTLGDYKRELAQFIRTGKDFRGEIALMFTGEDVAKSLEAYGDES